MELSDTFAGYKMYFAFIFAGLLNRNYLFSLFKNSFNLLGSTSTASNKAVLNRLKLLGADSLNNLRLIISPILKTFKTKFVK